MTRQFLFHFMFITSDSWTLLCQAIIHYATLCDHVFYMVYVLLFPHNLPASNVSNPFVKDCVPFFFIFIALFQGRRGRLNCFTLSLLVQEQEQEQQLMSLWIHMRNLGFWSVFKFDICQDVCKYSPEINPCSYTQPWLLIFFVIPRWNQA